MHLKQTKRNGRVYLSIVQNYRERGKVKTRVIQTIGYADKYAELYPDPVEHFKEKVRDMNRRQAQERDPIPLSFTRATLIDETASDTAHLGNALALGYLDALDVRTFFEARDERLGLAPHTARVFEMLAVERFMSPASRKNVWGRRGAFPRSCDFSLQEMGAALESIAACDADLVKHLNRRLERMMGPRDTSTVYLVVNSAVFNLTDHIGFAAGEAESAEASRRTLRMCVVTDAAGMPLGYRLMPERFSDEQSRQFVEGVKQEFDASKLVYVTERSPYLTRVMGRALMNGDSYVMQQPLHDAPPDLQEWVLDQDGYRSNASGSFRVKSRVVTRLVPAVGDAASPGEMREVPVKEVVLWSRDRSIVQANNRAQQKLLDDLKQSQINDTQAFRALEPGESPNGPDGAPLESQHSIDPQSTLIEDADDAADPRLDGYTCFLCNDVDQSEGAIFHTYRETWRLTEPFETHAEDFASGDFRIPLDANIRAHFLVCYTAFFAMRLLRMRMGNRFNASQVANALRRMEGVHLQDNWYLFSYRNEVTDAIQQAAGIDVGRRVLSKGDVRQVMSQVKRHIINE